RVARSCTALSVRVGSCGKRLGVVRAVVGAAAVVALGLVVLVVLVVLLGVRRVTHMPGGVVRAVAGLGDARRRDRGDHGEGEKSLYGPVAHVGFVPLSGGCVLVRGVWVGGEEGQGGGGVGHGLRYGDVVV